MIVIPEVESLDVWATSLSRAQRNIFTRMQRSRRTYRYPSIAALEFELTVRVNTVESASLLARSGAGFASFENSKCNEQYWELTSEGGFKLRPNVLPSQAVQDIYTNSSLYAFECAAAMVIVLYKAVLDTIGAASFNSMFGGLYIWSWNYDKDLRLVQHRRHDVYPGDIRYFDNPDVDPATPEWQGENVIVMLETDNYYGHGIGITSAQRIIEALNHHRKPNSTKSAYLQDDITHMDYTSLYTATTSATPIARHNYAESDELTVRIGSTTFVR